MRIALFVTCLADTLFPGVRQGHRGGCSSGSATRWSSREAQTCCGQMHVNTGYQRDALPLIRRYVDTLRALRRDRRAVRLVRRLDPAPARDGRPAARRRARWPTRAEAVAARTYELSQLLVDVLGVEDVGAYYPHRVTYHPTCHSLRLLRVGDRPLRLLRKVRGHRPGRAARRGRLLRLRRHVRGQERRHLDRDAGRQDAQRARTPGPRCARPATAPA